MKIRITGTQTEIAKAAQLVEGVLTVLETSRPYQRRNSRLVSVYLETDTRPGPVVDELRGIAERIEAAFDESSDKWTADHQLTLEEVAQQLDALIKKLVL